MRLVILDRVVRPVIMGEPDKSAFPGEGIIFIRLLGVSGQSARPVRFLFRKWIWLLAALCWYSVSAHATPFEMSPVRIGVLAFRPANQTLAQWTPTASYLESELRGRPVVVLPLTLETVEKAVAGHEIDFLLANPEQYVVLAYRHRLAAVATLLAAVDGKPVSRFGGVIFSRTERADIAVAHDIAGKRVAAVSDKSFAGYLAQSWTLQQAGVDVQRDDIRLVQTGLPQDRVVQEVLSGRADVGFVRTGVLEALEREGKVAVGELRVIQARNDGGFPQRLSTDLYPEWPLAALATVPDSLVKAVTVALYRMPPEHPAARSGAYYGFAPPGDYTSVEALLHRLHIHPDRLQHFGLPDIGRKYAPWLIAGAAAGFVAGLFLIVLFLRQNRQLKGALARAERLALRDDLLTSLSEGVYGVDPHGRCTFVNHAALEILGFTREEVLGCDQHLAFHHHYPDGREYPGAECPVSKTVRDGQPRHTEEVFFHKSGRPVPVRIGVQPIWQDGTVHGAVVAFQDISEQQAAEARIREMALHDALTGLPNRRLLNDRLAQAMARGERLTRSVAVLFLDLDGFKPVNDACGHDAGDVVLIEVGRRLAAGVRAVDTVARLAGDEFVVVLADLPGAADAEVIAAKLVAAMAVPVVEGERQHRITASIGIALWPVHGQGVEDLLRVADQGMYAAKKAGKNGWQWGAPLPVTRPAGE